MSAEACGQHTSAMHVSTSYPAGGL